MSNIKLMPYDDEVTDVHTMPFGKHKGTLMSDVPGGYLLYLAEQDGFADKSPGMMAYIDANRPRLEAEKKEETRKFFEERDEKAKKEKAAKAEVGSVVNFDEE